MKYVSLTFDDGRSDNYEIAFPIMQRYGLIGTLYCTTGYIDGSWQKPKEWRSAGKAISIEHVKRLRAAGWELGIHGDKHITEADDAYIALRKMHLWDGGESICGFSMPNSIAQKEKLDSLINALFDNEIMYIRKGRKNDLSKLSTKALFGCYSYLGSQMAYNAFNSQNITSIHRIDRKNIYSVVIRNNDNPQMIIDFVKRIPDETWVVFMLHSILPQSHPLYGTDPWNWSSDRFEKFCSNLKMLADEKCVDVKTVAEVVNMFCMREEDE